LGVAPKRFLNGVASAGLLVDWSAGLEENKFVEDDEVALACWGSEDVGVLEVAPPPKRFLNG